MNPEGPGGRSPEPSPCGCAAGDDISGLSPSVAFFDLLARCRPFRRVSRFQGASHRRPRAADTSGGRRSSRRLKARASRRGPGDPLQWQPPWRPLADRRRTRCACVHGPVWGPPLDELLSFAQWCPGPEAEAFVACGRPARQVSAGKVGPLPRRDVRHGKTRESRLAGGSCDPWLAAATLVGVYTAAFF